MAQNHRLLDATWRRWLKENLERGCSPEQLVEILHKNGFADASIQEAIASFNKEPKPLTKTDATPLVMDSRWQNWLRENVQRGCDPQQLLQTLLDHGFSRETIMRTLTDMAAHDETEVPSRAEPGLDYAAIANPPLLQRPPAKLQTFAPELAQLFTLDDFMSEAECDTIVAIANRHLRPSTVTVQNEDKYYRTSRTCDLSLLKDPRVTALDLKIAKTLGIRPGYSEGIQAQRYDVGQEFKQHTDFFEPGTDEYTRFAADRGNRTWTFMVYLNDGMEGGGTRFFTIDRTFVPKKGQAVIWNNLYRDGTPNRDTLHSGEPVTAGHKIIITKWFRENGSGEMFYS
jgi:prolyl 4-hydroxylase